MLITNAADDVDDDNDGALGISLLHEHLVFPSKLIRLVMISSKQKKTYL